MFGDVLRERIHELSNCSEKQKDENAFWRVLKNIAADDIRRAKPQRVDSDIAIALYYDILCENIDKIPLAFREVYGNNKQEKFRVINRNIWSSNAFNNNGLAKQPGIKAFKEINESRKGFRIVYQGE